MTAIVTALGWGGFYPGPFALRLCEAGGLLVGGFVLAGLVRPAEIRTFLGL